MTRWNILILCAAAFLCASMVACATQKQRDQTRHWREQQEF